MNKRPELKPEQPEGIGVIKSAVCRYCKNNLKHGCINSCAPEGFYGNLQPMELDMWHDPPRLPSMATMLEYTPATRLALMYLILHYTVEDSRKMRSTLYHRLPPQE